MELLGSLELDLQSTVQSPVGSKRKLDVDSLWLRLAFIIRYSRKGEHEL